MNRKNVNKEQDMSIDELTGLRRGNAFFQAAKDFLQSSQSTHYCLMAVDIEHFKLFNEWYGKEEGDRFLISIGKYLKDAEEEGNGLAGYLGRDDFCIILPNREETIVELQSQILGYVKQYGGNAGFLPAFGLYPIEDAQHSVSVMYDRACMAISEVKGNYRKRAKWYNSRMMKRMKESHKLLTEVQRALEQKEFTFYSQPKCNLVTGKIVGLESLVRWEHPEKGIMAPAEFLPVLEENGFITELDLFVWEAVCIRLRSWIDRGHTAIPISVNVSRVDIYAIDVVETFCGLIRKYELDPHLLEIEITESAYVEDYQLINKVVEQLRETGFTILMDDFGSGYSSLNMLKDVSVDILKIDMKFLEVGGEGKGLGILEAIIGMAQLMDLRVIAEGVETKEQKEMLLNMGCLYGQGYYFYKPLAPEQLELLLADESNLDFRGIRAKRIERLNVKELLNRDMISEAIVNNMLGGIAFYNVHGDNVELIQVNEQYSRLVGSDPVDLEERRTSLMEDIHSSDRQHLLDIFEKASMDVTNGAQGDIRRIKGDGSTAWMHIRVFLLKEQVENRLFYGTIMDVTETMELRNGMQTLIAHIPENVMLVHWKDQKVEYRILANGLTRELGLSAGEYEQRLNKGVYDECNQEFLKEVKDAMEERRNYRGLKEIKLPGISPMWIDLDARFINEEEGKVTYLCKYADMTEMKQKEQEIWLVGQKMESILRQAGINSWDWDMGKHVLTLSNVNQQRRIREKYMQQQGKELVINNFPECVRKLTCIQDEYKEKLLEYTVLVQTANITQAPKFDLPVLMENGDQLWFQIACEVIRNQNGVPVKAVGYHIDITEQKKAYLQSKANLKAMEIDCLTGLFNRQAALPRIEAYLASMQEGESAAMLMCDMDNFKQANDMFGHVCGDSIIAENGRKLRGYFRDVDIVCRMGGDEFLVLCKNIDEQSIHSKLSQLVKDMVMKYEEGDNKVSISISVGYVMIPEMGNTFDELYKKADIALFAAKAEGKSICKKYNLSMKEVRPDLLTR